MILSKLMERSDSETLAQTDHHNSTPKKLGLEGCIAFNKHTYGSHQGGH